MCAHMIYIIVCDPIQDVIQLQLEMHLEAFHCVEVEKIDWSKPLSPQVTHTHLYTPINFSLCGIHTDHGIKSK